MITLTFDDCYISQKKEAQDLLKKAGIKASFYVIADYLEQGNYSDYMKNKDILELSSDGHEIGSHTVSHPRLNKISKEQVVEELTNSRNVLRELGIEVKTFVYPYGQYNEQVIEEVKKAGYTCARSTLFGYNDQNSNPYILKCQPVYRWTPFFLIAFWIRKSERKNLWLILMFHRLDNQDGFYGSTPEMFRRIIQYISDKKIQTVTMHEGAEKLGLSK